MPGNYCHYATIESFGRVPTLNEITGLYIPPNYLSQEGYMQLGKEEKRTNL
jgi:hypothetical protein